MNIRTIAIVLIASLSTVACASTTPSGENVDLFQGPQITETVSPYQEALQCVASHLTPEQKKVSFAVGFFPDRTGRMTYSQNSAAGAFMTQAAEDMLTTSLKKTGVQVSDVSPAYRNIFDWTVRQYKSGKFTLFTPDVVVIGSISSLDFLPGGGMQLNGTIKAGHSQARILVAFEGRVTTMPFTDDVAAKVITAFSYSKQVVAVENGFGATGFVGNEDVKTFLQLEFGENKREALQYIAHAAMDVTAYRAVTDVFQISDCDQIFAQSGLRVANSD